MKPLPYMLAWCGLLYGVLALAPAQTPNAGVLPLGADGKPLNLDFETGTLKDWTAQGTAFNGQPIAGDTVAPRRGDMKSRHQGKFWIGGYEKLGDKPTGTLTSAPFKVTHPWASYLIGGGPWPKETCVELVDTGTMEVFHRASGIEEEDLRREVIDLAKHQGKTIQIRLVDRHTGHWGHLNFDDFRFHAEKPNFPPRPKREAPPPPDVYKHDGLMPEAAAAAMTVPEGFEVSLFAGEPDVHQPVGFCIDDRGRVWVAEAYVYPKRIPSPGPLLPDDRKKDGDRILIFEDTNGDGRFDKKTTFLEGLNLVSGIEVGFGGVWIGAAPYLLFVPDKNRDDVPDGPPEILLDGWGFQDTHETLNAFIWGPDGWLYGCHGVFTHSRVGKPGTPDEERTRINAGIWRYHPTQHVFEVFSEGTSNPWGLDYNDVGEFFIEACVIPHCFHMVQGGRYQRQAGQHFNPHTYADIQTIADHRHYVGPTPHGGNTNSDSMGGGHAHCGLMCYLGGTWPQEYRGQLFMGNIHGRRLNVDIPKPQGSSYVASHGKDFLLANDAWARFINLRYGPDGNVYLIDWYDKQACHRNEPEIWDRTNGRIFKISYKGAKAVVGIDLQKKSDLELAQYMVHENDWYVRHARRILQERMAATKEFNPVEGMVRTGVTGFATQIAIAKLKEIATAHQDATRRLRGLWALNSMGALDPELIGQALQDENEYVRAWAVRLGQLEANTADDTARWVAMAKDASPVVRRAVASAWQKQPAEFLAEHLPSLLHTPSDAGDPILPYLYWYLLERHAAADPAKALDLAVNKPMGFLLPFTARRVAALGTPEAYALLTQAIAKTDDANQHDAFLRGLQEGLRGRRDVPVPQDWAKAFAKASQSNNAEVRARALAVAVALRDPEALEQLRAVARDAQASTANRRNAITALIEARDPELANLLKPLVKDPQVRSAAIRGLASVSDAGVPAVLLEAYPLLPAAEKRDAVNTLAARATYAQAMLDAIDRKQIPAADVPAELIRQLRNLGDKDLDAKIARVWGTVRETAADRKQLIAAWTKKLSAPANPPADLSHGRAVFTRVCQQCHTLYGVGGKVGPDITGANRADLGYLLENIFDPSAVIPKEYAATKIDLVDGRVITGIIKEESDATLTVATANETLTLAKADVEARTPSPLSMMPDDLTKQASEVEIRALIAYLRHNQQVPLPATSENVGEFFNGKDLAGWDADPAIWSVENGELVGKTATGLKRNNFAKGPLAVRDFKLSLQVKLTPNKENSGIQFRSAPLASGEMRGPQADIGAGWWGKLYEEEGRGLLWKQSGEQHVRPGEWNDYVVEAVGSRVRTWINGQLCVDLDDPMLSQSGLIGFQVHSGGPLEVRFKNIKLEVLNTPAK